jgi:hypothetical protein
VTGNAGSDFRIKLLVVHPDGRRQKFLVTFPERRTLKIDQRYIGLPLTLRVDFVPGAIIARPGTGHALSIAGKPVKEHSLTVNDVVGLDQYSIEFLELPEPLPMEEATRFVSINDISEATVVVSSRGNDAMDNTPNPVPPALPHRPQAPPQAPYVPPQAPYIPPQAPYVPPQAPPQSYAPPVPPANIPTAPPAQSNYQPQMYRPDPEDSTAVIRRLQVPGTGASGNNQYSSYANLQPTGRTGDTATGFTAPGVNATNGGTSPGINSDTATGVHAAGVRFGKKHIIVAGAALAALTAYLLLGPNASKGPSKPMDATELASQAGPDSPSSPQDASSEMKPMDLPDSVPAPDVSENSTPTDSTTSIIPAPQPVVAAPVPMVTSTAPAPSELAFDDKTGFDPMAVDGFFDAVDAGDEKKIKDLIDKRLVDVNLSRRRGYAALHLAAARGDLATVKYLVKLKADPNVLDGSGATPVMWSVFRRHEDVVKFLAPKTDLKIARQGGETAYDLAKRMKMNRVLKSLDPEPKKTAKNRSGKKRVPTSLPKKK